MLIALSCLFSPSQKSTHISSLEFTTMPITYSLQGCLCHPALPLLFYMTAKLDMSPFSITDSLQIPFILPLKSFVSFRYSSSRIMQLFYQNAFFVWGVLLTGRVSFTISSCKDFAKLWNCYSVKWSGKSVLIHGVQTTDWNIFDWHYEKEI